MADKVDVTFSMSATDVEFLIWAMDRLKGGPHDKEHLLGYWRSSFPQAGEDHFAGRAEMEHDRRTPDGNGEPHARFHINLFDMKDDRRSTLPELCCSLSQQAGVDCHLDDESRDIAILVTGESTHRISFRIDDDGLVEFGRIVSGNISDPRQIACLASAFEGIGWQAFREDQA
jgi:hypothetical protein